MVARDIWDVEAAGSNPVTPTIITSFVRLGKRGYFFTLLLSTIKKGIIFLK